MNKPETAGDASSIAAPAISYERISRQDGLPNRVRSQLLQMIASGALAPGDRLAPERELAGEMGVSRNVVREAIRSLVDSNVLEARQGAGVFVAALDVESLIQPLELVLALESATLHSLAQARIVMEPGIAALAAQHGSDEDMARLAELIAEERELGPENEARLMELDVELHGRLVRMTDNPFLVRIMESIGRLARSSREFTNSIPSMREAAKRDHERIVAAVRHRDPEGAEEAMRVHLEHVAQTLVEESVEQLGGSDLAIPPGAADRESRGG